MSILFAIILGTIFGFVLQKVCATNPMCIINMLTLRDLSLAKKILLGIGISSLVVFILMSLGLAQTSHISVKSSYIGVLVGGAIFGIGWAIAAFCPGTAVAALGSGSKKAIVFIIGGLVGAFIYTLIHGDLAGGMLFEKIAGGKVTLADTGNAKYESLLELPGLVVSAVIAIAFILGAIFLPNKIRD